MKALILITCFFPVFLAACSSPKNDHASSFQASPTLIPTVQQTAAPLAPDASVHFSATPTMVLPSTPITRTPTPITVGTSTPSPIPYPPPGYPATPAPTELPTPTPTLELPSALDRKDPLSLVQWFRYGLEKQDLSYIKPLLARTIRYSLAFSDLPGENLSKATFLSELKRRLANHPICISYNVQHGVVNELFVVTGGWNPTWEFDGAEWDYLILDFSDYWTKEEGLYLYGAYVTRSWWTNPPDWISCR